MCPSPAKTSTPSHRSISTLPRIQRESKKKFWRY